MRIWKLQALGTFGVLILLFGVASLALTQTVSIRPFSWHLYWQLTWLQWILGVIFTLTGFGIWRLAVKEIRTRKRRTVDHDWSAS